ncbi:MAG: hypothetical protein BMS9Abin31_1211 [Gammaproteobacteria bacterium]|nr:MAG: hypothetical protein BMS9Abin31_1211 [Gammaproteobacteria bacterium]
MDNVIPFPDAESIVFACAECDCHKFIVVLDSDKILCSQEHPDGIKWVYREEG